MSKGDDCCKTCNTCSRDEGAGLQCPRVPSLTGRGRGEDATPHIIGDDEGHSEVFCNATLRFSGWPQSHCDEDTRGEFRRPGTLVLPVSDGGDEA
jgi:hypothetical protein